MMKAVRGQRRTSKNLLTTAKWSDHTNSDPVNDILELVDNAANLGVTLTRAICSPKTFRDIMANVNVKNMFRNADQSLRVFSRAQLIAEIATVTGVTIAVYNKSFIDEDGATKFYAPDNKMVFFTRRFTWCHSLWNDPRRN